MGFESKRGWRLASAVCASFLLGISLFAPALINRQPILYSDSVGYFHAGHAAMEQIAKRLDGVARGPGIQAPPQDGPALARQSEDGITTARSVYYGLPFVLTYLAGGPWAPIAGQVFLTLACLLLAARRALAANVWIRWACLFTISLTSGLGFFTDTIMPDVFAGLMLLAAGMLLAYGPQMRNWERAFWLAIVLLACLFHKSHLAILIVLLAVAAFLWRGHIREFGLLLAAVILSFAAHAAVDFTVQRLTGKPPISTPFLLARLVGDGTAEKYLRQECPTRDFTTCGYVGRLPMTENEFLWSHDPNKSVMGTADRHTRQAIAAESNEIALATIATYPVEQALATAKNVLAQFVTVGVREFALVPSDRPNPIASLRPVLERYQTSTIAQTGPMLLAALSAVILAVYLISIAAALWWLIFRPRRGDPGQRLAIILLLGIGANAAVCGALSAVIDRYQGRVAWLALLALATVLICRNGIWRALGESNPPCRNENPES